ncbi:methyltransferase domain-containing protein [Stieleria tagensis]|uniref:methyltransferase domain-containing protein n=1 Tax=Stieleria tagensis TaxID=2956795 RepID=UPI0028F45FDA|nr:methyltransferase domain-containing protein [Stieleria tagensis]
MKHSFRLAIRPALIGIVLSTIGGVGLNQPSIAQQPKPTAEIDPPPVPADINANFKDPELDVAQWLGRFEVESREVYAAREQVLKACEIQPGESIADIGAGTGFYSRLFARQTGWDGWVYSVDISTKFLQHIAKRATDDGIENLTTVLGTDVSVRLPTESVDLVFICDTYHHFESPTLSLASIYRALKPGGRMVLIDFERIPGQSREFILGHVRAGKDVFRQEIEAAGFEWVDEVKLDSFEENYLLRFRKPDAVLEVPPGDLGDLIRLGEELVQNTNVHPLTTPWIGNSLNCTSCHLDAGKHRHAASFIAVAAAYPAWSPRENQVITLESRISNCFLRSQNGTRPPEGSQVCVAIASYITWLSEGTAIKMNPNVPLGPNHVPQLKPAENEPSLSRGEILYADRCADCHGDDGGGGDDGPAVWGADSFNDGAGLSKTNKMASWLKVAMPLDDTDLSDQEAYDIAAYVNSHPRPKFTDPNESAKKK